MPGESRQRLNISLHSEGDPYRRLLGKLPDNVQVADDKRRVRLNNDSIRGPVEHGLQECTGETKRSFLWNIGVGTRTHIGP